MVPQHLNRLFLLPDQYLMERKLICMRPSLLQTVYSKGSKPMERVETDESLSADGNILPKFSIPNKKPENIKEMEVDYDVSFLLHSALWKIPQIPFQYVMDAFRWKLFNGSESMENANDLFWELAFTEQGISPPDWVNRHEYFDPGAKFHVVDNTPYTP